MAAQIVAWSNTDCKLEEPPNLGDYAINEDKAHQLEPELAPDDQPLPWDAWDSFIDELERKLPAGAGACTETDSTNVDELACGAAAVNGGGSGE